MVPEIESIEEWFRRRYGREALYLPSGRLALYLAFREWLSPGARVLMSPVTDDVVFFTVLAAGLVPVLGPLDPRTGNLAPEAVPDDIWSGLHAVLTTNLYGTPDGMDLLEERCRRHRLVLLEDACHAFDSRFDGRPIGSFGTAAAFSLGKHLEIPGGILAFADTGRRESLQRGRARESRNRPLAWVAARRVVALLEAFGSSPGGSVWPMRALTGLPSMRTRGPGHRMVYALEEVRTALRDGAGLDRLDRWVRVDYMAYRTLPFRAVLRSSMRRLEAFEENRRRRLEGGDRLFELGLIPDDVSVPRDTALLRVPLFVEDREKAVAHLARHGLSTEYIYDPPLDLYAPGLAEHIPSPRSARIWSRHVLPVNPLRADRFLAVQRKAPEVYGPLRKSVRDD